MFKIKTEKIKRGIIIGRFQPYHLGHHQAIKNIMKEVDELVIVIGSAQISFTEENPFTTGERIEMISLALKEEKFYERAYLVPVPDVNENALWTNRILAYTPKFDIVYTNNPLVVELFTKSGLKVKKMISNMPDIESVKIRKLMFEDGDWKKFLPQVVIEYLNEIRGRERIISIITEEKKE